jgi:hypothetical protein
LLLMFKFLNYTAKNFHISVFFAKKLSGEIILKQQ